MKKGLIISKAKKDIIQCLILVIITCMIFIPFLNGYYVADTYGIIERGLEEYSMNNSFSDGRFITGIFNLIIMKLNIPIMVSIIASLILAIIGSCGIVILLKNIILQFRQADNKWLEILVIVISYVTIFNFMYLDNLKFMESSIMAFSIFNYVIGAYFLVKREKHYLIKSAIFVILGMVSYQGTIGLFLALVFLFSILKNKNKISYVIRDVIISGILVLIAGLIDLAGIKIFTNYFKTNQNRLSNNIWNNILIIILNIPKTLTQTCGMFPKNLLLLFLSLIVILGVIGILNKYTKNSTKEIILYFALIIFIICSSFSSSVLSSSSFWAARMRFSLGALIGILFLYLYVTTDLFQKKNILTIFSVGLVIAYAVCNLYQYIVVINQSKQMNQIEEQECKEIDKTIELYEEKTGINVTKLARIYTTNNREKLYSLNYKKANVNIYNGTKCWWSVKGTIYFYTGRRLEYVNATIDGKEELIESKEEYKCIDDTLYIYIYQT